MEPTWKLVRRATIRSAAFCAVLFGSAGRLDWPRGWFFIVLLAITLIASIPVLQRENPRLLRTRLGRTAGAQRLDTVMYWILMMSVFAGLAVAGLDERFRWSSLNTDWAYVGLLLFVAGCIPIGLAAATNPFIERTVRIQEERGHVTVTTGPYRVVRHPMYAGILLLMGSWPLLLGSIWAYLPWGALAITIIVRTALEDRTLRRELSGYEEYTRQTRYLLLPKIW